VVNKQIFEFSVVLLNIAEIVLVWCMYWLDLYLKFAGADRLCRCSSL